MRKNEESGKYFWAGDQRLMQQSPLREARTLPKAPRQGISARPTLTQTPTGRDGLIYCLNRSRRLSSTATAVAFSLRTRPAHRKRRAYRGSRSGLSCRLRFHRASFRILLVLPACLPPGFAEFRIMSLCSPRLVVHNVLRE